MQRIHLSGAAAVLAITTSAWAGGAPYPADTGYDRASSRTRAEVIAELQAEPVDTFVMSGDPRMLRARIHAEAVQAGRLGLLSFGEGDPPVATAAQEELIAAAGEQAVGQARLAKQAALVPPADVVDPWSEIR